MVSSVIPHYNNGIISVILTYAGLRNVMQMFKVLVNVRSAVKV